MLLRGHNLYPVLYSAGLRTLGLPVVIRRHANFILNAFRLSGFCQKNGVKQQLAPFYGFNPASSTRLCRVFKTANGLSKVESTVPPSIATMGPGLYHEGRTLTALVIKLELFE